MAKKVLCPNCGVLHDLPDEPKKGTFENRARRPFRTDAMAPPMQQSGIIRETPVNLPTLPSHVYVPLYQSLIDGFFAFPVGVVGSIGVVAVIDGATLGFNPSNLSYALIGLGGGVTVFFFTAGRKWPIRLNFVNSLLWVAEEITGFDLDGDGEVGEPEQPERLRVEITENGVPRELDELEIGRQRLTVLAQLIFLEGKGFAERTAEEAGINREEWVSLRDRFVDRGWATWKNASAPKSGIVLRRKGAGLLHGLLPPTLLSGDVKKNVGSTHAPSPTQGNNYERFEHIER